MDHRCAALGGRVPAPVLKQIRGIKAEPVARFGFPGDRCARLRLASEAAQGCVDGVAPVEQLDHDPATDEAGASCDHDLLAVLGRLHESSFQFPLDTGHTKGNRNAVQGGTFLKPGRSKLATAACAANLNQPQLAPEVCRSVGDVLARVGDKWSLLVIYMLSRQGMRFNELRRALPSISQKVLTTTLRGLERDGYATRKVTPSVPPRVDYELTRLGRDALEPVMALAQWAMARSGDVERARAAFDCRQAARYTEDAHVS